MRKEKIPTIEEVFDEEIIKELASITNDIEMEELTVRSDTISELLSEEGFEEIGFGTNRIVFVNEDYPGVVFKIALDELGIMDNNREFELSQELPHNIIAVNYESNGFISIEEEAPALTKIDMNNNKEKVMKILEILSSKYILNDVGLKAYNNWGFDREGNIVCIDYAYLRSIDDANITICNKCGGHINYTPDMTEFRCEKCGKIYSFSDICNVYDALDTEGYIKVQAKDINNDGKIDAKEFEAIQNDEVVEVNDKEEQIKVDKDGFVLL